MTVHQSKAPRYETSAAALTRAIEYGVTTELRHFGVHVEPLHEGSDREVVAYILKITDEDGYLVNYL